MKAAHSLISTSEALWRVFIQPIEQFGHRNVWSPTLRISTGPLRQQRTVVTFVNGRGRLARTFGPKDNKALPRDENIPAHDVRIVDEENKIHDPRPLMEVLSSFDRKNFFLVQVAKAEEGETPICKILEKKKVFKDEQAKRKKPKTAETTTKVLEMNWAIDKHDLEHRMSKLKEFLEDGRKVEVMLANKRKGKKMATAEEANGVVTKIRETVKEVKGAKESKAMNGNVGKVVTMYFEGSPK